MAFKYFQGQVVKQKYFQVCVVQTASVARQSSGRSENRPWLRLFDISRRHAGMDTGRVRRQGRTLAPGPHPGSHLRPAAARRHPAGALQRPAARPARLLQPRPHQGRRPGRWHPGPLAGAQRSALSAGPQQLRLRLPGHR